MPMPNMITPSSGATCGATQANSPGRQRARAEQAMMMAPMKRVTRALNLCARRGKRALRLLGERGDAQKNVFRILAESANDGKRGRGVENIPELWKDTRSSRSRPYALASHGRTDRP